MNQVLSWGVHAPQGRPLTALPVAPTPCFSGVSLLLLPLGLAPALQGRKPLHPQPLPSPGLAWPRHPSSLPALCVLLPGTDPEETILHAFKVFDTEGKGFVKADL